MSSIDLNSLQQPFAGGQAIPGAPGVPNAPGTAESAAAAAQSGEPNNVNTSQQFWAMLANSGMTGVSGMSGVNGLRGPSATNANSNKYAGSMSRSFTLGAPPAPNAQLTPRSQAAYSSFQNEMGQVFSNARPAPGSGVTANGMSATQKAGQTAGSSWLQQTMNGLQASHNGMLLEFMKMRMMNNTQGVQELQQMASLSSDIQGDTIKQQEAEIKAAQASADKAQKKTGLLKIFQPIISAVMAIVAVALAVLTLGTATGLAVLMAAMVIGFLAAGLAGGHGKGFNFKDAIDGIGYAADAVLLATGVGEIIDAAMAMVQAVVRTVLELAAKAGLKQGAKAAAKAGAKDGAEEGAETGAETASIAGEAGAEGAGGSESLLDESADRLAREAAKKEGERANDVAKTMKDSKNSMLDNARGAVGKFSDKYIGKLTGNADNPNLITSALSKMTGIGTDNSTAGLDASVDNVGTMLEKNGNQFALKDKLGDGNLLLQLILGGVQGVGQLGQASLQYAATMPQLDSEEDVAKIKQEQATGDMWNNAYNTIQNTLSSLNDAHSKTVDQVNSMLNSSQQASNAVINNLAHR